MSIDNLPPWLSDPASLHVGQTVFHLGKPDAPWIVEKINGNFAWVVQGKGKDASRCSLPIGSLAVVPTPALLERAAAASPVSGTAPKPPREKPAPAPRDVGDVIAQLLTASPDVGPWRVLEMSNCGLDVEAIRGKIGHLSAGLQRMGIGNRLRVQWKAGQFNAEALLKRIRGGER